jgi:5-methylcytosine-specific restriction endonuclease McrA
MIKDKLLKLASTLIAIDNNVAAKKIMKIAERTYQNKSERPENVIKDIERRRKKLEFNDSSSVVENRDALITLIDLGMAFCAYCGKKIKTKEGIPLDRVDNSKDYNIGDVVWACWDCNKRKGETSLHYFLEDVSNIYKHLGSIPSSVNKVEKEKDKLTKDVEDINDLAKEAPGDWMHKRQTLNRISLKNYDHFAKEIFEQVYLENSPRNWKDALIELRSITNDKGQQYAWDEETFRKYLSNFKQRIIDDSLIIPYYPKEEVLDVINKAGSVF